MSVKPVAAEPYYDFCVPVHNNYVACGVVHHNCAKSMMLETFLKAGTKDGRYFYWLMGKFTEPGEVLGPTDIPALKQGVQKVNTKGKLPEAHGAFLDEIWKASTAVANCLLRVVNEKKHDDGTGERDVPLLALFAASNEIPSDASELGAMWDRMVLRKEVRYVGSAAARRRLLWEDCTPKITVQLTVDEFRTAHQEAMRLPIPEATRKVTEEILETMITDGVRPSDRRLPLLRRVIRAAAYVNGHAQVEVEDLDVLRFLLWDQPGESQKKCERVVMKLACPFAFRCLDLELQIEEQRRNTLAHPEPAKAAAAAQRKLGAIEEELKLMKDHPAVLKARATLDDARKAILYASINQRAEE